MIAGRGYLGGALCALLLTLPGCGSGSDMPGETTVDSLTKAQFLKQGNAICAQVFGEIDREYGKLSQKSSEAELNKEAQEIVPPRLTKMVQRLRVLGAPNGGEAWFGKTLAALEAGIEKAEEDRSTVRGSRGEFAFQKGYELLWDYGLTKCGLG